MLNNIIKFSLNNKLFILLGAVLLMVGGVYTSTKLDIDVFPDLTAPTVVVMTDCGGMAPEEVERLVTFRIETAMIGATDVRRVRSASSPGASFVWIEFDWGADIFKARQVVSEKISSVGEELPEGVKPVIAPQSSVMGEILFISLQADTTSMMELRTLADWVVKPAILSAGGVSNVTTIGGDYKQYQVLADPARMGHYGVSMSDLAEACRTMSVNASGGVLRQYGNEYMVRGMAYSHDPEELGRTLVGMRGASPVTVADVAEVAVGAGVKMGYASRNASPAVIISVSKQPGVNTLAVTENIEARLDALRGSLPADVKMDTKIFRQADFIETSVNNVGRALIEGALFVVVVLFVFLGSFRTTLISVIAIPLSLLGTVIVLYLLGMNVNTMTLGGMCIAIGSLVDDAIIDVENVFKRLRQNHALPPEQRRPSFDVVFNASKEIRASILNATFIIIAAFVPLFFLSGMEGRMLKPLGVAYIVSLFMSLVVAMTVTPLLCRLMLSGDKYLSRSHKGGRFADWLTQRYRRSLLWTMARDKAVLGVSAGLLAVAVVLFFLMGRSFLPEFNEGSLTISVVTKPGVSLDENNKLGNIIESQLLSIPEVTSTARRTGRGELDEHSQASNSAEIDVNFTLGKRDRDEFFNEVRDRMASVPGIVSTVGQPLGHRIDHMLSGTRAGIAIKIFGPGLGELFSLGNSIKEKIEGIEGLVDVSVEQQTETPQLQIRANRDMLARHGISTGEFAEFVRTAFGGEKLAEIYEGQRSFDLVLRLNADYTNDIDGLRSALISTASGGVVPLEEVADIVSASGPNSVSRENARRKIVVSANVSGRDMVSVVDDIKKKVAAEVAMPSGYNVEYGGQFESADSASRTLMLASLLALGVIFLLLYHEFRNVTMPAIVLLNLPLALIGGVLAVFFTSGVVSIPSIIGFITLFGIATRNGILLISRCENLRCEGMGGRRSVVEGAADRLTPILMTALTAALALIPLVMAGGKSGNEIQSPMAVVVLGGLLSSTLLNIYVVPIVYRMVQERKIKKQDNA